MKITKQIMFLSLVAFVLHLIWENGQAPLFAGYSSFSRHFPMCFFATIGDVVFTLAVYFGIGLLKNDFDWIARLSKKDIVVIVATGFLWATGTESWALSLGKWSYAGAMPIVPYLRVGLTPILQMTILLPLSFYLTQLTQKLHAKI